MQFAEDEIVFVLHFEFFIGFASARQVTSVAVGRPWGNRMPLALDRHTDGTWNTQDAGFDHVAQFLRELEKTQFP